MSSKYDGMFAPGYIFPNTKWTVVDGIVTVNNSRAAILTCRCECGVEKSIPIGRLQRGESEMCVSCAQRKYQRNEIFHIPIGTQIGELTVISAPEYRNSYPGKAFIAWYNCMCSCGKQKWIRGYMLNSHHSNSCGLCKTTENISGNYWGTVKNGAKRRNLEFSITHKMVLQTLTEQNNKCALSGVPIEFSKNRQRRASTYKEQTASIDRIDSSKGYVEGNIQIVHKYVNLMKLDHSTEEFIGWARKIVKTTTERSSIDKPTTTV